MSLTAAVAAKLMTLGQCADHYGVQLWMVQRVIDRGLIAAPPKVGRCRVLTEGDLPALREALVAAGYLPAEE